LFSCVVGLGQKFTAVQWKSVFTYTIFAVLDQVKEGTSADNSTPDQVVPESKSSDRYKVSIHHSRDSASKQWATTEVLTLRGIERVLRLFFDKLLATTLDSTKDPSNLDPEDYNWFESAWHRIVEQCFDCGSLIGGRETLDLRLVGVELLVLCCQASSHKGFIARDARVSTNMQVVNGALRCVRPSTSTSPISSPSRTSQLKPVEIEIDPALTEKRFQLFKKAFEVLIQFGTFLKENEEAISGGDNGPSRYIETTHLQVLSKLSLGLDQLYESCKDKELSPRNCNDEPEREFVELVTLISKISSGGASAKYLTQAQKPCLELLKTMSMNCSSRAFEVLAQFGSNAIFKQNQDGNDIGKFKVLRILTCLTVFVSEMIVSYTRLLI